jgi:hypothetical protein
MGEFQYFDIILFAMVAGFLVLRLRSVLGRRTGNERRRDLFPRRAAPAADNVTTLVEPDKRSTRPAGDVPAADAVAEGLNRIRRADSSFDPAQFIEGARAAFEMIVASFARGDKAELRPLLSDEVFQRFAMAIDERVDRKARQGRHRGGRTCRSHGPGDGKAGLEPDQCDARDGRKYRRWRSGAASRENRLLDLYARHSIHRPELGPRRNQQRLNARRAAGGDGFGALQRSPF